MNERHIRDVRDELGPRGPEFLFQSSKEDKREVKSKKRTREQAFGFESDDALQCGKKLKMLERSEVKNCNDHIEKYQMGIELVSRVKADQGQHYEVLQPAELTIQELAKRPLSWLGRERLEREPEEDVSQNEQIIPGNSILNQLDSITEKSVNAEQTFIHNLTSKLSIEGEEPVLEESIAFSVDPDLSKKNEVEETKQIPDKSGSQSE